MEIIELKKLRDELMEDVYEHLVKVVAGSDDDVLLLLNAFHDAGVTWESIYDAMGKFAEKKREKQCTTLT